MSDNLDLPSNRERIALVRAHDRDRYISAVLAPADSRADLILLAAFDAELARIPASVSEPLLGEIRLQWWRDALTPLLTDAGRKAGDTSRTGHPLADDLIALARRRSLPGGLLHGMIDARDAELSGAPFADEAQMWAYFSKTEGAMLTLGARLLAGGVAIAADLTALAHAAEPAGRALGLVRMARGLIAGEHKARLLTPLSIWPLRAGEGAEHGADTTGRSVAAITMLDLALTELTRARKSVAGLSRSVRSAFLPLTLVSRYVTLLRQGASGLTIGGAGTRRDINPLTRIWTLWRAHHGSRLP
jgi:15-cis-phytoene synthase